MIPDLAAFDPTRQTFLDAVEATGAVVSRSSHPHPRSGPDGQALETDVVRFGAPIGVADTVVIVTSGLHGVEGHAGSGLQQLYAATGRLGTLPEGVAVVFVHAVNPYGLAWSRRVDHENIDVNRNFIDYADLPANLRYPEIDHLLNPSTPDLDLDDKSFLVDLLEFWQSVGDEVAFRTISGGQYDHPHGVQHGGDHASWSRTMLESVWAEHLAGADHVIGLDLHTGLGPLGRLTVFQTADEGELAADLGTAWFPEWCYRSDREGGIDHGLLGPGLDDWVALDPARPAAATFVVEFGTYDPTEGVAVFRADNWLHHHGDPQSELGREIRRQMQDFFFVRDEAWRTAVAQQGLAAFHAALDGIAAGDHRR
jgi:hypothetical protein